MKSYEIRIGSTENSFSVPYNDRQYSRLSDAAQALKGLLELLEEQPEMVEDDLCFWILRTDTPSKKALKAQKVVAPKIPAGKRLTPKQAAHYQKLQEQAAKQNEKIEAAKKTNHVYLAQVIAGVYENIDQYGYEGMYFLNNCNEFEKMTLIKGKDSGWMGHYIVTLENALQRQLCFYSNLDIILQSLVDLSQNKEHIADRLITISKREPNGEAKELAQLFYSISPEQNLVLKSTINAPEGKDRDEILAFVEDQLQLHAPANEEVEEASEAAQEAMADVLEAVQEEVESIQEQVEADDVVEAAEVLEGELA